MIPGGANGYSRPVRDVQAEVADLAEQLSQTATWLWYPDTGETEWSDNLFRVLGYEPGEVEGTFERFFDALHPDDRADLEAKAALGSDVPRTSEYRVIRTDGEVRYIRTTVSTVLELGPERRQAVVGVLQDMTRERRADRVIRAHVAVSTALAEWDGLQPGAGRLLRGLGGALGFVRGALFVPRGDELVASVLWVDPPDPAAARVVRDLRLPRGSGIAGLAWERCRPVNAPDLAEDERYALRDQAREHGIRGALAIPAIADGEALAILTFGSREKLTLPADVMHAATGIGYEIGQFLSHRRGELAPPILTPREVEVLQLAARGGKSRDIAAGLVVSPVTVKSHFEHIYRKLGVHDRATAVGEAMRLGLIE